MGYVHHWQISDGTWWEKVGKKLVDDAQKIITKVNVSLCFDGNDPSWRPLLSIDKGIQLNGAEEPHEDFVLRPNSLSGWCKTDRKEYDIVVCTILIRMKVLLGEGIRIKSDGEWDCDWLHATQLHSQLWPDEVISDILSHAVPRNYENLAYQPAQDGSQPVLTEYPRQGTGKENIAPESMIGLLVAMSSFTESNGDTLLRKLNVLYGRLGREMPRVFLELEYELFRLVITDADHHFTRMQYEFLRMRDFAIDTQRENQTLKARLRKAEHTACSRRSLRELSEYTKATIEVTPSRKRSRADTPESRAETIVEGQENKRSRVN